MSDYKLVPVEPTLEMVKAACDEERLPPPMWTRMKAIYRAMLAAAPAVQGEPTDDELLDWAGEEQFFLFCDKDEFLQIARAVMHRYMGRQTAVQGEPVAYAVFASNGNIRVWCADPIQVETLRQQYGEALQPLYTTPASAEQQPALAKYQPCGCVICNCEHETQCQGCGAKHCGTHPIAQFSGPVYQQPSPDVTQLVEALECMIIGACAVAVPHNGERAVLQDAVNIARDALAAHRKPGGES